MVSCSFFFSILSFLGFVPHPPCSPYFSTVLSNSFFGLIPRLQTLWMGIFYLSKWCLAQWSACAMLGFLHAHRVKTATAKLCLSSCLAEWLLSLNSSIQMFWLPKPEELYLRNKCCLGAWGLQLCLLDHTLSSSDSLQENIWGELQKMLPFT